MNCIIVIKYLCIFKLKNPGAIQDDFWSIFLNAWILGFIILAEISHLCLHTGKKSIFYWECLGENPAKYTGHDEVKPPKVVLVIVLSSILIHISIGIKMNRHILIRQAGQNQGPIIGRRQDARMRLHETSETD